VGIYFVTQNPSDIPDTVLGQLGNRVQHALRAFTPRDQKAVQTAAQTLRANPKFDAEKAITELGVGEALVSFLDEKGTPTIVERAFVLAPFSRIGPLTADERAAAIKGSVLFGHYEQLVDRESAYEKLKACATKVSGGGTPPARTAAPAESGGMFGGLGGAVGSILVGSTGPRGGHNAGVVEMAAKSAARAIGSQVGREIIRGVLGSILGGRSR
jgi:DNA helicase HerA-like ATPase